MAMNLVPVKTALGADELRGRSRSLGQRLRTVLLLVDGRRSLGEVLSLAQQAGAQASLFDELVRAGMVKLPDVAPDAPAESSPPSLQSPGVSSVQSEWPSVASPGDPAPAPDSRSPKSVWPRFGRTVPKPPAVSPPAPVSSAFGELGGVVPSRHPVPVSRAAPLPQDVPRDPPARHVARAETAGRSLPRSSAPAPARSVPVTSVEARLDARARPVAVVEQVARLRQAPPQPSAPQRVPLPVRAVAAAAATAARGRSEPGLTSVPSLRDEVRPEVAPIPAPRRDPEEAASEKLEQVRSLLFETLRLDSPLFGARMLLRLREAASRDDLIELVWAIERHLAATRHSRKEMLSLHRARELLGLGNTVVPEE